jgi:ferritin
MRIGEIWGGPGRSRKKIYSNMNANRLSEPMQAALNAQMNKENHQAQIYLSYGCWADGEGFEGISNFLFRHSKEERDHMMKFLEYILKRGGKVKVGAIPAPTADPSNVNDCFEKVFKQEVDNTTSIYQLVKLSMDEGDWATWNFMQWFVREQTEEENLAIELLDMIKVAGGKEASHSALFSLDKRMGERGDDAKLAPEVTTDKP